MTFIKSNVAQKRMTMDDFLNYRESKILVFDGEEYFVPTFELSLPLNMDGWEIRVPRFYIDDRFVRSFEQRINKDLS